MDQYLALEP